MHNLGSEATDVPQMRSFVFFLTLFLGASLGRAGDVWVEAGKPPYPTAYVYFEGRIEPGDADKITRILNDYIVRKFTIWSPGGDVREAINIANILRSAGITVSTASRNEMLRKHCITDPQHPLCVSALTEINCGSERHRPRNSANCICASACAIVWLTAFAQDGISEVTMPLIGVHQPKLAEQHFSQLPFDRARVSYDSMMAIMREYLQANGVAEVVVHRFLNTPNDGLYLLNMPEIEVSYRPGPLRPWLIERCPLLPDHERIVRDSLISGNNDETTNFYNSPEYLARQSCVRMNIYEALLALQR
jgi:hypothetical protein